MIKQSKRAAEPEVIEKISDFDTQSGSFVERILFNNRVTVIIICLLVTVVLGYQATTLRLNASYEKMLPTKQPYIKNYLKFKNEIGESGNALRIVVESPNGSVYTSEYLETLQKINDEIFLAPGVFRSFMRSLWTPNLLWNAVTEQGLEAGPVIPRGYDGSAEAVAQVRINVARANGVGQVVSFDEKSSLIYVPLLSTYANGEPLDYAALNETLESIRTKYEKEGVRMHITGFAKIMGDLIDGLHQILLFFAITLVIACAMVYWYTRCARSTALVVICTLMALVWQMGVLPMIGIVLDPYSVLVPFLIFAIGLSHGSQKMNGIMQDIGRGTHKLVAARYTFRRLFFTGLAALLTDAVGFAVLLVIRIRVIQELAISASIGVAFLIFTNLILVPVLLSFTGVSRKAALRALEAEKADESEETKHLVWKFLDMFTRPKGAAVAITAGVLLAALGLSVGSHLRIGDLDPGAPELRPDSRYNRDNAYLTRHYGASSDVFGIILKTPEFTCSDLSAMERLDALEWELAQLKGVEYTNSLALLTRGLQMGMSEGNPKWYELVPTQSLVGCLIARVPRGIVNGTQSLSTLNCYLQDHKADTLTRVVEKVKRFAAVNNSPDHEFLMASGNAGIEAATNIVVKKANRKMLWLVYASVISVCFLIFRSWRSVTTVILPLVLTSILAEAVMVWLRIGVKVATLPVIALGVGIGVDYALYIWSITLTRLNEGMSLSQAYYRAMTFTGKVVLLIGVTLTIGVITWTFSPIKFQADMGILLAFMFTWNMLGAMILLPALGCFLFSSKADRSLKKE